MEPLEFAMSNQTAGRLNLFAFEAFSCFHTRDDMSPNNNNLPSTFKSATGRKCYLWNINLRSKSPCIGTVVTFKMDWKNLNSNGAAQGHFL